MRRTAASGPGLPTFAVKEVGSYVGYTGRTADVVVTAAHDPIRKLATQCATQPGTHREILMFVSSPWLPDEAKIETEQEEDEMYDGPATADLRCFDKT